jgi:hypothetical protein
MKGDTPLQIHKVFSINSFYYNNNFTFEALIFTGPSKGSVNSCIIKVAKALINRLSHLIGWPKTEEENRRIALEFSRLARPHGFPLVVGAVDGTLVEVTVPVGLILVVKF